VQTNHHHRTSKIVVALCPLGSICHIERAVLRDQIQEALDLPESDTVKDHLKAVRVVVADPETSIQLPKRVGQAVEVLDAPGRHDVGIACPHDRRAVEL
jgi:hypothetical protein